MIVSCNSKKNTDEGSKNEKIQTNELNEPVSFFPLGNFIKGQLSEIKSKGVNPIKYTFKAKNTDSTWIKMENLENDFADLLYPLIDSASMSAYFKETSFMDETLNNVTFSYDPTAPLPEKIPWLHWDIYIDPESNSVSRVYMVKKIAENKKEQITLIPEKNCRIIVIDESAEDVKSAKISDVLIKWEQ